MNIAVTPYPEVTLTEAQLRSLDVPGPRYTSYPTADRFVEAFGPTEYRQALRQRAQGAVVGGVPPLSLYVHIPFCDSLCYYCACNKIITKHHSRGREYLGLLAREIDLHVAELGSGQGLTQLHLGGGSPTFLSDDELSRPDGPDTRRVPAAARVPRCRSRSIRAPRRRQRLRAPGRDRLQPGQLRRAGLRRRRAGRRAPGPVLRKRAGTGGRGARPAASSRSTPT